MRSFWWPALDCWILPVLPLALFLSSAGAQSGARTQTPRPVILGVRLNQEEQNAVRALIFPMGRVWLSAETLDSWRIRKPSTPEYLDQGIPYRSLDGIPGLTYRVDTVRQELEIEAGAKAFVETRISRTPGIFSRPPPASPGGFFNYDLLESVTSTSDASLSRLDGALELGVFGGFGVVTGTGLARDLTGSANFLRLDTTVTHDNPETLSSYRLGDSISRAGAWGRPVRFGGAQWSTNFGTQPGYVTFPIPSLKGEAALPATVDVFVNNMLRSREEVPAGPFEINNVPLVTGQGEVVLVVRDYLGRETLIAQPYYVTPGLLRAGLKDFSLEAGTVREDYAINGFSYGPAFLSGTYRLGVSDAFTPEAHSELSRRLQNLGATATTLWSRIGTLSASAALSRREEGNHPGGLFSMAFNRQYGDFGFGTQGTFATRYFSRLGDLAPLLTQRLNVTAHLGFSPGGAGSLALTYIDYDLWAGTRTQIGQASYSFRLPGQIFTSLYLNQTFTPSSDSLIGINLTRSVGSRTTASTNAFHQGSSNTGSVQLQQNLQDDPGIGYRVLAETGTVDRGEAGLFVQTGVGNYSAEISRVQGNYSLTAFRLGASGGISALGGGSFLSRRLNESFGVVRVNGYPDVTVYAEHRPIGRTRWDGRMLIPRLRPYDINRLSIEQKDLPIDAQVDALDIQVVPFFRSGVIADFPVKRSRAALLRLVTETGTEVPPGAIVRIRGRAEEFPVAHYGEAFVTGLSARNQLEASWDDELCEIDFYLPDEPLPAIGPLTCRRIR